MNTIYLLIVMSTVSPLTSESEYKTRAACEAVAERLNARRGIPGTIYEGRQTLFATCVGATKEKRG
jgi:hypothetical protein